MSSAVQGAAPGPPWLDLSIVTHNSSRWIDPFFESLFKQNFPLERIRVWVRDNDSRDDTLERLETWSARLAQRGARYELDAGANVGFGRGHNVNWRRSDGPYILVTNVDLTFEPDALVRVVAAAESDGASTASWELRQKPYEHPKIYHPASLETLWSSHACVLLRRSALAAVGGYEEELFLYGEDVELSYRLRDSGFVLRYVPSAVCWHYTYAQPHEFKPAQFFGSKLANGLLRLRYGSASAILAIPFLYTALWCIKPRGPKYYRGLCTLTVQFLSKSTHFVLSRHRSDAPFPFAGWDYEQTRSGAFYPMPPAHPDPPLVSVITRTMKGRQDGLRQALQCLANQTHPNVEVIVIEDGSSEARALAESYEGVGAIRRIRYLGIGKSGRCVAGNRGLEEATGAYLGFLDDDDLLFADHLETLVAALEDHPDRGAAYGLALEVRAGSLAQSRWGSQKVHSSVAPGVPFSRALLWDHNYLPIQTVLFRRELYARWGGFDPELENLEDWNLWVRYSLESEFEMIDRVTSLYLVPRRGVDALGRLAALDSYSLKARQKNGSLKVELTVGEALEYAQEIGRYNIVGGLARRRLRAFALGLPFSGALYHSLRRIAQALARRSGT